MKYKFEEIAINSTTKKKPVDSDKVHYIGLEHLDSQSLQVVRFGSEVAPKGEKLIMKKGDVLFGKRRAYQKKVGIAPFDGIFSAHGMVLRPNEKVVSKNFFPFFISSDYFLDKAISISVGSLSPTINWSDLKVLEFDLPSLEEQERLAKVLWKIEEIKFLLNDNKLSLLNNYQTFIRKLAKKYSQKKINDIVKKYEKISVPIGTTPYLEIGDINILNKTYSLKDKPSVTGAKLVKKSNILISLVRPTRGAIAIIKEDDLAVSNAFCVLNIDDQVLNKYIYYFLLFNYDFYNYFEDKQNGSTYPTCKEEDVYNYYIPLPPSKDMVVILEKLQSFIQIHRNIDNKLQEYKNMQKQIIKEAFNV